MREIKKSAIKVNKDALLEYERLKQNDKQRCAAWVWASETEWFIFHNKKEMLCQTIDYSFFS